MDNNRGCIPDDIVKQIVDTPIPSISPHKDSPSWLGKGSGKFSGCSCYLQILKDKGAITEWEWEWMWKLKFPNKKCCVSCGFLDKKNSSSKNSFERNISQDPYCKYCGQEETNEHTFRNCNNAKKSLGLSETSNGHWGYAVPTVD